MKFSLRACTAAVLLSTCSFLPNAFSAPIVLEQATIADLNAGFDAGTLSSEKLIQLCLARIKAYDDAGPKLNALILINPKALEEARALDAERKAKGPRSAMHGIPVILKDNFNTADMPTTGGSVFLEGSIPPADAFMVAKLREAGAIILAKANLSEFATSAKTNGFSSFGGQTLNPHDLTRGPAGSSGGSGSAVAAWYAPVALGTDTGGSIRNPCSSTGIAGLKPTRGLVSRSGIIPLVLSFDTGGPMARNVYDVAASLGAMTGVDPTDPATASSLGRSHKDYTVFLKKDALKGARLGVLTDYTGLDAGTKKVFAANLETLRAQGATLIEIKLPEFILKRESLSADIRPGEFKAQLNTYLATLKPGYPKTLSEIVKLIEAFKPRAGVYANPSRWEQLRSENEGPAIDDPVHVAARINGPELIRGHLDGLLLRHNLDAFIYPTNPTPAQRLDRDYSIPREPSATSIANITGFPDLIVPAGVTAEKLPVTLSFMGTSYSEPRLFALGYAFEQAAKARVTPSTTPALAGETF